MRTDSFRNVPQFLSHAYGHLKSPEEERETDALRSEGPKYLISSLSATISGAHAPLLPIRRTQLPHKTDAPDFNASGQVCP
jgi:hypothetical protein